MKTNFLFPIAICALLIAGCGPSDNSNVMLNIQVPQDTVLVLSIPDWALGKTLTDSLQQPSPNLDSLKALRNFDNTLFKAILSDSTVKYVYTRKFNPCCPCSPTKSSCCLCQLNTKFIAPSTMHASVKINGNSLASDTKQTSNGSVDFFNIPPNTPIQGLTLVIDGIGIAAPLQFSMTN